MLITVALRLIFLFLWVILLSPFQIIFRFINVKYRYYLPVLFHKGALFILGVKVLVSGKVSELRPLMLAGNHSSYLDILVLGSVAPVCFIAKSEISKWPLFGWLARLQDSVFIERKSVKTVNNMDTILENLSDQFSIVLFPEGTTSDGNKVLPFKSSLFHILEKNNAKDLKLQNFSICYTNINGLPLDRRNRPSVTWFGDMSLVSHFLKLLNLRSISVKLSMYPIISVDGLNRKKISNLSYSNISNGLGYALSGRRNEN